MQNNKKGIAILGSTGSIGTQALEVISCYPEYFDLQVLTAGNNVELLIEQSKKSRENENNCIAHCTYVKHDDFDTTNRQTTYLHERPWNSKEPTEVHGVHGVHGVTRRGM